jgi:hypothetical protein
MKMEGAWRFDSPGALPREAVIEFDTLVGKVAAQGNRWAILEHFKRYFAGACGSTANGSSSESWAESDLNNLIWQAADNAPLFIEAFYEGCESLRGDDFTLPEVSRINRILADHQAGFEIRLPAIVAFGIHKPIPVPERYQSLDEQAQDLVQQSFRDSERLLSEGHPRQAVQEILWLMESVLTAFKGLSAGETTIEAKYFNKIAIELRTRMKGQTIEQVLTWLTTLHGYLSSPTGGGVRHGVDLKSGVTINADEGRLYCNLIRSYVTFLMAEHERLSRTVPG